MIPGILAGASYYFQFELTQAVFTLEGAKRKVFMSPGSMLPFFSPPCLSYFRCPVNEVLLLRLWQEIPSMFRWNSRPGHPVVISDIDLFFLF